MPTNPAHRSAVTSPTAVLPQVPDGGHHSGGSGRLLLWVVIAGGVFLLMGGSIVAMLAGANDRGRSPAPVTAQASPSVTGPTAVITEEPTPGAALKPVQAPQDLIAALRSTVTGLAQDGHLDPRGAEDLLQRLTEAEEALAARDTGKAWRKLNEFGGKVEGLRKEGKLSADGYLSLAATMTKLAQALPRD